MDKYIIYCFTLKLSNYTYQNFIAIKGKMKERDGEKNNQIMAKKCKRKQANT